MTFEYVLWKYTPVNSLTVPTWQSKDKFSRPIHIKCCKCCGETNGRQTRAQYPRGFTLNIRAFSHVRHFIKKQTKLRPSWEVLWVQFTPRIKNTLHYIITDVILWFPTSLLKSGTMWTQTEARSASLTAVCQTSGVWKPPSSVSLHTITQSSPRSCPVLQRLTLVSWRHAQSVSEREGLYQVPASDNPVEILQSTVRNIIETWLAFTWSRDLERTCKCTSS